jgi:hypothetical protein
MKLSLIVGICSEPIDLLMRSNEIGWAIYVNKNRPWSAKFVAIIL